MQTTKATKYIVTGSWQSVHDLTEIVGNQYSHTSSWDDLDLAMDFARGFLPGRVVEFTHTDKANRTVILSGTAEESSQYSVHTFYEVAIKVSTVKALNELLAALSGKKE